MRVAASAKKEAEDCVYQVGQIITLAYIHIAPNPPLCAVRAREKHDTLGKSLGSAAHDRFAHQERTHCLFAHWLEPLNLIGT
jgi:hypothetical protein